MKESIKLFCVTAIILITASDSYSAPLNGKFTSGSGGKYPNPFNPVTHLEFGISDLGFVSLKVYDVLGREIKTLVNEIKSAGNYSMEFDGSDLSSGVYYYKIESGNFSQVRKMILLK